VVPEETIDNHRQVTFTGAFHSPKSRDIVSSKANSGFPRKGEFERMARRRYQDPKPVRRGAWWTLLVWEDQQVGDRYTRKRKRVRLAPATMMEREVRKVVAEYLRPMNQGLESVGSATNFKHYVEATYKPVIMSLMASTTQERSEGVIRNYLYPAFEKLCLRDLTMLTVQRYF